MGPKRRNCFLLAVIVLVLGQGATILAASEPAGRRMLVGFRPDKGPQTPDARAEVVRGAGGAVHRSFDLVPAVAARLSERAIERLKARQDVEYVEEDVVLYAIGQVVPWGVNRIDADLAWPTGNTGRGVKVAVLDTGIDYDHPDLRPAGGVNYAGTARDGSTNPADWNDNHGHGTHVAGIIAARNNTIGVIGVAPDVSLYAVKVLSDTGSGYTSDIIQGLNWCAANGVRVASMSLGGGSTTSLKYACDRAYSLGVLLVAAAGNNGGAVSYPAAYSSVIAVAATDSYSRRASFSNYGSQVELAGPGVSIYSTYKNGLYGTMSGTSMACPHVSGAAALAWASGLTSNRAVRSRLVSTAEDLGTKGFDIYFGYGLVDAQRAAARISATSLSAADANGEPGIRISAPQDGATVSGVTRITAAATNEATRQVEFLVDGTSIGVDNDDSDGWATTWDTSTYADGPYTVTATATDEAAQTVEHSVTVTVNNTAARTVSVQSITYSAEVGPGNGSLLIRVQVADSIENPVANASVLLGVFVDGRLRWTLSGATGADGAVSMRIAKARPGLYEATVAEVTAQGLTWDGATPPNQFANSR